MENEILASYINDKDYNHANSIMCSNQTVRGLLNLLFNRGIYELKTYDESYQIAKESGKKYLIYLNTVEQVQLKRIVILDLDNGNVEAVSLNENGIVVENEKMTKNEKVL